MRKMNKKSSDERFGTFSFNTVFLAEIKINMKIISATLMLFALSADCTGQSMSNGMLSGTVNERHTENNIEPLNGNGTLGIIFDSTACGLQYTAVSQKIGQRFIPVGVAQPAPFVVSSIPANASIIRAYLCTNGSGNGAAQTATISGPAGTQSFPMIITGTHVDYCWTFAAAYTYRADVTSIIGGNGTYNISGLLTCGPNAFTNDMSGAVLFIIYNDPTANYDARLVLADGALSILSGTGTYTMNYPMVCSPPTSATAFGVVSDFQFTNSSVNFNGSVSTFTGARWDFVQLSTTITSGQTSSAFTATKSGDCFCLCLTGLYMQTSNCITCPSSSSGVLNFSTTSTADVCSACNGTASVTSVSGGIAPYTYQWNTVPVQTTVTATGLCAGTYSVIVTSSGGFYADTQTVVVPAQGAAVSLSSTSQSNNPCFGDQNGSATLNASGGVGPYTYSWLPASTFTGSGTTTSATGLASGTYTSTITDAGGCSASNIFVITEPPQFSGTIASTGITCNGDSTATATLTLTGGTLPYYYTWLPYGGSNATATGLAAQTYTVSLLDNNGCNYVNTVTISEPAAIGISNAGGNVLCYGANDGYITTNVNGGNSPYYWAWSTGDTTQNIFNLGPGTYSVTVTDASGCTEIHSAIITEPLPLLISVVITEPSACGATDGSIDITPSGAVPPYIYSWNTGSTSQDISILASGVYTVIVSDISGCSRTEQIILNDPTPPVLTFNEPIDTVCSNGNPIVLSGASPSGGTFLGPAVNGGLFYPLNAGIGYSVISYAYTDTVTQCTGTIMDSIYVDVCNSIPITTRQEITIYPNPTTGTVNIAAASGAHIELYDVTGKLLLAYSYNPSQNMLDLGNLSDGIYFIQVTQGESTQIKKIALNKMRY